MKKYDVYGIPAWFPCTEKEAKALPMGWDYTKKTFSENLAKIKLKFGNEIVDFTVRKIPDHLKKNKHDFATFLIVKMDNGKLAARRFNNSSHLGLANMKTVKCVQH